MTHEDINTTIKEWLWAREMLRRLGFDSDDIYFACQKNGHVVENDITIHSAHPFVMCILKTQSKEFTWSIGPIALPVDEIEPAYLAACTFWNTDQSEEWRNAGLFASRQWEGRLELVKILLHLGFYLPAGRSLN